MPSTTNPSRRPPRVLILCGIPGSGKSTLASFLEANAWMRVSQDDLGSRQKVEAATRAALGAGRDVVVDRCNFDAAQRAHWVSIGRDAGAAVGAIVLTTSIGTCVRRVRERKGHPTLMGRTSEGVVRSMFKDFRAPTRDEGIDYCRVVAENEDGREVCRALGLV